MKALILPLLILISFQVSAAVKFASYNIRTFDTKNTPTDKKELKKILKNLNADFITVQEIINTKSFKSFIRKEFPRYRVVLSKCGGAGKQMIGFVYDSDKFGLFNVKEDNRISNPKPRVGQSMKCASLRPALVGTFVERESNQMFTVLGLHLKAGGRPSSYAKRKIQYRILRDMITELRTNGHKNVIVMGDLNTTGYLLADEDYKNFTSMLTSTRLKTISSELSCTSYWSGLDVDDNIEESSVLDHILYQRLFLGYKRSKINIYSHCERSLCANVSERELGLSYNKVSDHCPIAITME